jgi:hypothetical protein
MKTISMMKTSAEVISRMFTLRWLTALFTSPVARSRPVFNIASFYIGSKNTSFVKPLEKTMNKKITHKSNFEMSPDQIERALIVVAYN